ncbi:MAG: NAD(P)-dependent glycerol-3-phosphate dehydrogenase [Oscillospiraceae bacterium]|nr:NAD(P)-dependent glycerol-3-phosphate dehydrogenase [Oscillospiraceae bacterium]
MKKRKIAILGAGAFGLSLAVMLDGMGHSVTIRSRHCEDLLRDRENKDKLPGIKINERIEICSDISCVGGKELVVAAVPTGQVRSVMREAAPYLDDMAVIANTGKGLEADSYKRMSEVINEETDRPCVVLTGPSHAEEVAVGMPTTIVAACGDREKTAFVQGIMTSGTLRVYINDDVIGCEIGGALKNVIALCAGICDGMKLGDNTKAALMTRGIWEISRLGVAMGGKMETFAGLAGVGDLIVTCTSMHSRNRRAGMLIGEGVSPEKAVERVGTVEGYFCTKAAFELSRKFGICLPITEQCYRVLYEGASPKDAIRSLMTRPSRRESENALYDI